MASNQAPKLEIALNLATEAGQIISEARSSNSFKSNFKDHNELVTSTDQQVDNFLISELKKHFPDDQFLTEESYQDDQLAQLNFSKGTWVIDPIDGTVNFALGHPQVAVSIAYVESNQVQFGIVHCPFLNETFHAQRQKGAFLNNQAIQASTCNELNQAIIATGLPYDKSQVDKLLPNINKAISHGRDIRRNGSAAIDLCWVACGRLQAYFETVQPWDMAAGALIAKEAGAFRGHYGKVNQEPHLIPDLFSRNILVCSKGISTKMKSLLD